MMQHFPKLLPRNAGAVENLVVSLLAVKKLIDPKNG